jgi:hypothetical protein
MQALLAGLFGAATVLATLNILGADMFNFVLLTFSFDPQRVADAVPGTVALLAILGGPAVLGFLRAPGQGTCGEKRGCSG